MTLYQLQLTIEYAKRSCNSILRHSAVIFKECLRKITINLTEDGPQKRFKLGTFQMRSTVSTFPVLVLVAINLLYNAKKVFEKFQKFEPNPSFIPTELLNKSIIRGHRKKYVFTEILYHIQFQKLNSDKTFKSLAYSSY